MKLRDNFLHNHDHTPQRSDHEHVVVDRADWEEARRLLLGDAAETHPTTDLPSETATYEFRVFLAAGTDFDNKTTDALFEAGCDDALPVTSEGRAWLRFGRESASLELAISSAINDIRKAGCTAIYVELAADSWIMASVAGNDVV